MAKWGIKVKVKQSGNFFNKVLEKKCPITFPKKYG